MTFKILFGLTYNSMNWSNLCICCTFKEWFFVYCTVFSRISRKCRNFCDLHAYFTKWEILCNIVWLSYQNQKYRVDPKKRYRRGVLREQMRDPAMSSLGNSPQLLSIPSVSVQPLTWLPMKPLMGELWWTATWWSTWPWNSTPPKNNIYQVSLDNRHKVNFW